MINFPATVPHFNGIQLRINNFHSFTTSHFMGLFVLCKFFCTKSQFFVLPGMFCISFNVIPPCVWFIRTYHCSSRVHIKKWLMLHRLCDSLGSLCNFLLLFSWKTRKNEQFLVYFLFFKNLDFPFFCVYYMHKKFYLLPCVFETE